MTDAFRERLLRAQGGDRAAAEELILENSGLITRQVNQYDRRIFNLYLTDEGITAAKAVDEQAAVTRQKITADLTEEDLHALLSLMEKLNTSIRNNVSPEQLAPPPHGRHGHPHFSLEE